MYSQYYQEINTPNETVGAHILTQIEQEEAKRRQMESDQIYELFIDGPHGQPKESKFEKMHDMLQRSNHIDDVDTSCFSCVRDRDRDREQRIQIRTKKESIYQDNRANGLTFIAFDVGAEGKKYPYEDDHLYEEDDHRVFDRDDRIMTFYYGSLSFFALYITIRMLSRVNGR